MSIFSKVLILFLISFSLMIFVSNETNKLTQRTMESFLKEKYIQVSQELFTYLSNNDKNALEKKLKELKFKKIEDKQHYFKSSKVVHRYETELSTINILKHEDDKYLLYMKYLDDDILVIDISQDDNFTKKELLHYMILADITILIIMFLIILKIIYPLRGISKSIKNFGDGDYSLRIENSSKDEIGKVSNTFNSMAANIEELITSREILLRDIGHELKTPILKSKLAAEMIEDSKYKSILKRALSQIDEMTSELLYLEKLNANQYKLDVQKFSCETLIAESLSKLFIEDETLIDVKVESNFYINADLNYLSIALKNLIDNALKYSTKKPVYIVAQEGEILVKSSGKELDKSLEFYCEAFTQGDNSRNQAGYGLGLSLVKRILQKHSFKLLYYYKNGFNVFVLHIN
ncbi:ArsS family sensor histidine kinase [Candidatus Sulfurimonas baltica]|uniref:histidine kinase n=1 Tax=Candidatus Sulfurimonas baltica TaxID=2740404 RepID=A0A7S7LT35_9BACT|nr:ArsS family sensor histidine kinase [Candidatus Sulfurimonas baltica]QOY51032.1 HAMP domain-containing histidine kinase [Candidatus Sulfurimonas baltica]